MVAFIGWLFPLFFVGTPEPLLRKWLMHMLTSHAPNISLIDSNIIWRLHNHLCLLCDRHGQEAAPTAYSQTCRNNVQNKHKKSQDNAYKKGNRKYFLEKWKHNCGPKKMRTYGTKESLIQMIIIQNNMYPYMSYGVKTQWIQYARTFFDIDMVTCI